MICISIVLFSLKFVYLNAEASAEIIAIEFSDYLLEPFKI